MAFKAVSVHLANKQAAGRSPVIQLYRTISKELPRVLTIYDADLSPAEARTQIQRLFRRNAGVKDPVVADMLIKKGYMELEETLMQWKQKTHLLHLLAPETEVPRKYLKSKRNREQRFLNNIPDDDEDYSTY